ncbi:MAG: hypothetical protein ACREFX_08660, partial [Opitutaceae bacterium]
MKTLLACCAGLFAVLSASAQSQVNVSVDAGQAVRTLDERLFGINATEWDGSFTGADTVPFLQAAQVGALRFPGGSTSDAYNWQTGVGDMITQYNSTTKPDVNNGPNSWSWAVSFDQFETVAQAIGAQVIITTNYGDGTPAAAAAWVRYANITKGYNVRYWEIGNECFGTWEVDTNTVPHDPYTYATRAAQYITAMKAVDPTIQIGVVAVAGEDDYANNTLHPATNPVTHQVHNGWTPVMLTRLKALGVMPDFLIFHLYPQNPGQESDAGLLQVAPGPTMGWQAYATNLRMQLDDYLGSQAASRIELDVTENNSVSSNGGKQLVSLVNGLYLADSLGNIIQTEFNSFYWWALRNGNGGGSSVSGNMSPS